LSLPPLPPVLAMMMLMGKSPPLCVIGAQ